MTRLAIPFVKKAAKPSARPTSIATSADAFFSRVAEIEGTLERALDAVDKLFASQARLAQVGGNPMTQQERSRINAALAFDLQGLRRAVAAAQAIALCGPEDAECEAMVAPMLAARAIKP